MTFDFFNTSNLAFGAKLTRAFKQLNDLKEASDEHLQEVYSDLIIYGEYLNRNYLVPVPNRPDAACQTNQAFDIINDEAVIIRQMEYNTDIGLTLKVNRYNRTTNRMTIGSGTTTIKEGYCYLREAISNNNPNLKISFSRKINSELGDIIFKYKISDNNVIQIDVQDEMMFLLKPSGSEHYTSISFEKISNVVPIEPEDNIGYLIAQNVPPITNATWTPEFRIDLNNIERWKGITGGSWSYVPLYLRKGDKITRLDNADIYKIKYNVIQ